MLALGGEVALGFPQDGPAARVVIVDELFAQRPSACPADARTCARESAVCTPDNVCVWINDATQRSYYHGSTMLCVRRALGRSVWEQLPPRQNYMGHNYIGQNSAGRDYIGDTYIGHNCTGHNYIGRNYVGQLPARRQKWTRACARPCDCAREKPFVRGLTMLLSVHTIVD